MRLEDNRAGVIASTIVNFLGSSEKPVHPHTFFPSLRSAEEAAEAQSPPMTSQQIYDQMLARFPRKKEAVN